MERAIIVASGEKSGCLRICVDATLKDLRSHVRSATVKERPLSKLSRLEIKRTTCLILPGGATWADDDRDAQLPTVLNRSLHLPIAAMVANGGIYIGICGGAFLAVQLKELGLPSSLKIVYPKAFGCSQGHMEGTIKLSAGKWAPPTFRQAISSVTRTRVYYENGPLLRCRETKRLRILASYKGEMRPRKPHPLRLKRMLKKQSGKGAIVACKVGNGCIVLVSPHPEFTPYCRKVLADLERGARQWCCEQ